MSKRILVVEDQPDNRQIIRDMLAGTDYEIREAEDGEHALAAVAKQRPDLILMGVQLPIMDGYEVTRQIKEPKIWKRHLAKALLKCLILLVPGERFELPTNGLQNRCSTTELTRLLQRFQSLGVLRFGLNCRIATDLICQTLSQPFIHSRRSVLL